jgi:hypothetical protein
LTTPGLAFFLIGLPSFHGVFRTNQSYLQAVATWMYAIGSAAGFLNFGMNVSYQQYRSPSLSNTEQHLTIAIFLPASSCFLSRSFPFPSASSEKRQAPRPNPGSSERALYKVYSSAGPLRFGTGDRS